MHHKFATDVLAHRKCEMFLWVLQNKKEEYESNFELMYSRDECAKYLMDFLCLPEKWLVYKEFLRSLLDPFDGKQWKI